eukprot:TRINITY_DN48434_c0_g1_i1.p1 TRINITY_DN48434_c0_g1~~TRINITY_DN48434_c0_g1_i1.p1  ORF type:complete len:462 (-),score=48.12 TRINITY_DN48434_c0_g1_i1:6-1391(-)
MFAWLCLMVFALAPADACNSTKACDWPYNNPYTATYKLTFDGRPIDPTGKELDCCATMPFVPLIDTGAGATARVVSPPHAKSPGAVCPAWSDEVVVAQGLNPFRNGSLYSKPKIFFADGLDGSGPEGHFIPNAGLATCQQPHRFYTKYVLARSESAKVSEGIPILGSASTPDAAMLSAAGTIAEMLRQMDSKLPGIRSEMVRKAQRFAVWADVERRNDTCKKCLKLDPFFDCGSHIDSRAGRDTSYHPEIPECVEGGGGSGLSLPTSYAEEYGIPYPEADGSVRDSYCGTNIVAHEFFHSIHETGIQSVARPLFMRIEQATARATREGIYVHHPGAKDDGCNDDFTRCVAYEFIVKAHMTWNGFPADKREFVYQSRAELKEKAPWIAQLVYEMFEDGDWNPALGVIITKPRDQTFGLTCATAPGSALCGKPLSRAYIGRPMQEVIAACGGDCWRQGSTLLV